MKIQDLLEAASNLTMFNEQNTFKFWLQPYTRTLDIFSRGMDDYHHSEHLDAIGVKEDPFQEQWVRGSYSIDRYYLEAGNMQDLNRAVAFVKKMPYNFKDIYYDITPRYDADPVKNGIIT